MPGGRKRSLWYSGGTLDFFASRISVKICCPELPRNFPKKSEALPSQHHFAILHGSPGFRGIFLTHGLKQLQVTPLQSLTAKKPCKNDGTGRIVPFLFGVRNIFRGKLAVKNFQSESSSLFVKVDQWLIGEHVILWDLSWVLDKQPLSSRRGFFSAVFGGLTTELNSRINEWSLLLTDKQTKLEFCWGLFFGKRKWRKEAGVIVFIALHCPILSPTSSGFPAFFFPEKIDLQKKEVGFWCCRFNSSPRSPSSPRSNSSPRSGSVAPGFGVVDSRSVLPWVSPHLRWRDSTDSTAQSRVLRTCDVWHVQPKKVASELVEFPCFHASILLLMEEIPNNHLTCMKLNHGDIYLINWCRIFSINSMLFVGLFGMQTL